jgi:hypothetical protein
MDMFNDFSKFSFKPIIYVSSKFDYDCCNLTKKIKVPKIVNIPFTNDYFNDLYSKIPYHSQR